MARPIQQLGAVPQVGTRGSEALALVQGWLADSYGLQDSFYLTAAHKFSALRYAIRGSKTKLAA